jgi:hypothetical protein
MHPKVQAGRKRELFSRRDRSPYPRRTLPSLRKPSAKVFKLVDCRGNIPSSFFSSSFSSGAPSAAAPPAAGAAPPAPPEGTDASLLEPSAINYAEILALHLILRCISYCVVTYLLKILALELRDESGEALVISFDTDGFENGLDVLLGRRGVAAEGEEEVCCEVLHFVG